MKPAICIFGRTPDLSLLELTSVYPNATRFVPGAGMVLADVDPQRVIGDLGGTVKIVELLGTSDEISGDLIASTLIAIAKEPRITFGISTLGDVTLPHTMAATVKERLSARGLPSRYVATHDQALSSVVVAKQNVIELYIFRKDGQYHIGVTRAVQDFEDWNKRDYGRPATDPKAGMLPPKVARMIANIALGAITEYTPTLLDPFCGVGTILAEAMLRGCNVIGSDLSQDAIAKARENIEWLRRAYPRVGPLYAKLLVADATHLSTGIPVRHVDAIATEPFMGENLDTNDVAKRNAQSVKNMLKGLEKLYIGALREWATIVKPGGRVVMAMPSVVIGREVARVKNVVDRCESLGYTLITDPIVYSRPQAVVRREFYVFEKI